MTAQPGPVRPRRWPLAAGALAVLVVLAVYGFLLSPVYRLDRVEVTGAGRVSPDTIRRLAGVSPGDLRWRHPAAEVRRRLLRSEPWLQDVQVEWQAGGVLAVAVAERQPLALLPYYNLFAVLDARGVILEVASLGQYRLPVVTGIPLARGLRGEPVGHPHLPAALALLGLLPGPLAGGLSEVAVGPGGALTLVYGGPLLVTLGPPDRLEEKVAALAAVPVGTSRTLLDEARLQRRHVDLRNPRNPVLTGLEPPAGGKDR